MALKMKELMARSEESKSTILFYIKAGLLPAPQKPKPNLHLYDESCLQRLKFIKYLQHNFSYTIEEIASIFQTNQFEFDGSFEAMVNSLELISGGRDTQWYSHEAFLEVVGIDAEQLAHYEQRGYLFARAKGYSSKEVEIVQILQHAQRSGLGLELFDAYVQSAKALATLENRVGSELLASAEHTHNARYELLFDVILKLKPYLFNMHTVATHHHHIQQGVSS